MRSSWMMTHLQPERGEVVANLLRARDDVPADLATRPPPCLVALHAGIAAMPPRVSGLDAEAGVGPRQVEVDHLAGAQRERKLTLRLR